MPWRDRIIADPEILAGKPVIRGTRLSVELILDHLASGWSHADLIEAYPHLAEDDIRAALAFAADMLGEARYLAARKVAA
ncbi:MAG: DUF433 domain-containing protein [Proteobacteria bacterium]|nr:DUF433 domain-containing protein [Pseudomonadota bacterium]